MAKASFLGLADALGEKTMDDKQQKKQRRKTMDLDDAFIPQTSN
jgi:hypothetical protein